MAEIQDVAGPAQNVKTVCTGKSKNIGLSKSQNEIENNIQVRLFKKHSPRKVIRAPQEQTMTFVYVVHAP